MRYHAAVQSTDNIMKAETRLPNHLCNKFYKEFKGNDIDGNKTDLLTILHWLDESLSEAHNAITLTINLEEKQGKVLEKSSIKRKDFNGIRSLRVDSKDDKTDQKNYKIICWLYTGNHKILNCKKLKNESTKNCRRLVKQKKLCLNCLSNKHD